MFYQGSLRSGALTVDVSGAQATQLAYRIVWSADGAQQVEQGLIPGTGLTRTFEGAQSSVCYELFGTSLTTGKRHRERHLCATSRRCLCARSR